MALTANGFRTGRAGASDLADMREYVASVQDVTKESLLRIEKELMQECFDLEGESFVEWYESDAVPAYGKTQERIDMLRARIAELQSQPSPIDEAQEIEREIDEALDSASVSESDWQAAAISEAEFDADTKWTQECAL